MDMKDHKEVDPEATEDSTGALRVEVADIKLYAECMLLIVMLSLEGLATLFVLTKNFQIK